MCVCWRCVCCRRPWPTPALPTHSLAGPPPPLPPSFCRRHPPAVALHRAQHPRPGPHPLPAGHLAAAQRHGAVARPAQGWELTTGMHHAPHLEPRSAALRIAGARPAQGWAPAMHHTLSLGVHHTQNFGTRMRAFHIAVLACICSRHGGTSPVRFCSGAHQCRPPPDPVPAPPLPGPQA